ncbi:MAG: cytochrome c maturation protein CcmE [Lysobacteraceae bacterium]
MTPVRKRRLIIACLVLAAAGIAGTLMTFALQENLTYLYSPSDVLEGKSPADGRFRLGGVVREGSLARTSGTLDVHFDVTDLVADYPVLYTGILPDLFREGQSVIARGRVHDGVFVAEEVLAKHDETYMPPEVAEKISESHVRAAQIRAEQAAAGTSDGSAAQDSAPDSDQGSAQ